MGICLIAFCSHEKLIRRKEQHVSQNLLQMVIYFMISYIPTDVRLYQSLQSLFFYITYLSLHALCAVSLSLPTSCETKVNLVIGNDGLSIPYVAWGVTKELTLNSKTCIGFKMTILLLIILGGDCVVYSIAT